MRDIEYPRLPSGNDRQDISENYRWQYELTEKLNYELEVLNDNLKLLIDSMYGTAADDENADKRDSKTKIASITEMLTGFVNNVAAFSASRYTRIVEGMNMDDLTEPGFYGCPLSSITATLINCPTTANFTMIVSPKSGSYITQTIITGQRIFTRTNTSGGFTSWFMTIHSGDIIDSLDSTDGTRPLSALQGKILKDAVDTKLNTASSTIAANSSTTLTLTNGYRGAIFITGVNNNLFEIIPVAVSTTGTVRLKQVISPSGLTVTSGSGTVTIANGTSNAARVDILVFTEG